MSPSQKSSINKTIAILLAIMVTMLTLFVIKITTPRYLSTIELKINGLILLKEPVAIPDLASLSENRWLLVVNGESEVALFEGFSAELRDHLAANVTIINRQSLDLDKEYRLPLNRTALIKPTAQYIAYFKKPYDEHKFLLTLSSVMTHR